jgi:hypothetical protein
MKVEKNCRCRMFVLEAIPGAIRVLSSFNNYDLTQVYRVFLIVELNTEEHVTTLVFAAACHMPYMQAAC